VSCWSRILVSLSTSRNLPRSFVKEKVVGLICYHRILINKLDPVLRTMFTLRADLKGRDTSFSVGRPINFPELVSCFPAIRMCSWNVMCRMSKCSAS
jgi:hypothetical protein